MRSSNGTTNWHVLPNWTSITGFNSLTFDASKTLGETWFYKVVRNTVGFNIRRIKSLAISSIQTEYFGVGHKAFNLIKLIKETSKEFDVINKKNIDINDISNSHVYKFQNNLIEIEKVIKSIK